MSLNSFETQPNRWAAKDLTELAERINDFISRDARGHAALLLRRLVSQELAVSISLPNNPDSADASHKNQAQGAQNLLQGLWDKGVDQGLLLYIAQAHDIRLGSEAGHGAPELHH